MAIMSSPDLITLALANDYTKDSTAGTGDASKGSNVSCDNSTNFPLLSLTTYGRSTQGYASHGGEPLGKNLLSINQSYEISEAEYVWQLDSIVINAGTYTVSFQSSIAVPYSTAVAIIYQLEGELAKVEKGFIPQKGLNTYTFTVDKPIVSIRFYANDLMIGATISDFQLEKGNTATEYEPYYSNPNPECPVPIESIGDSGSLTVTTGGKNLFFYSDYTKIPISPNAGGAATKAADEITIVTSDRSSSGAIIPVSVVSTMLKNFNGCKITMSCDIYSDSEITISMGFSDLPRVKLNSGTWGRYSVVDTVNLEKGIRFYNKSGIAATIKIRNIQLEKGSTATDYEPYKGVTAEITTALPLRGIPVSSDGNYTDNNGQRWVCDELVVRADGTGKIIKRTAAINLKDYSSSFYMYYFTSIMCLVDSLPFAPKSNIIMSSVFIGADDISIATKTKGYIGIDNNNLCVNIEGIGESLEDGVEWLSKNDVTVVYALATPTETELTEDEVTALLKLRTYDGVTNIYNSEGADMSVEYCTNKVISDVIYPILNRHANEIEELRSAILSLGGNI